MAVNCDGNLKTAARANVRTPIIKAFFDWDDVGFAAYPTGWYDESARIRTAYGRMEAVNWLSSLSAVGKAATDQLTIVLSNEESGGYRRFSLADPNSTLYSKIGDNKIKFKRAIIETGFSYGGSDYTCRQITGYVTALRELQNDRVAELDVRDRSAEMSVTEVTTDLMEGVWAYDYVKEVTSYLTRDKLGWHTGGYGTVHIGAGFFPLYYAWADGDNMWEDLSDLAESQMGRCWFDKNGQFHFEDAGHWVRENSNSWLDPLTSQETFTDDDYGDLIPEYAVGRDFERVVVEYNEMYAALEQTVYSGGDVWMVFPGQTETFTCNFRHPAQNVRTPVLGEDYTVINPGGREFDSGDYTINFTFYATRCEIEITNNHSYWALVVAGMTFNGEPIYPRERASYEAIASSPVVPSAWSVRNPFIQDYIHAQAVADYALERYENHVHAISLVGCPARPWLEVGDRITVQGDGVSSVAADQDYFIARINWTFGPPYQMDIQAIRCSDLFPYSNYFVIGGGQFTTSTYGSSDRLFW